MKIEKEFSKTRKRLILNIDDETHLEIKIRAAVKNISLKNWVLRAIQNAMIEEDKYNS